MSDEEIKDETQNVENQEVEVTENNQVNEENETENITESPVEEENKLDENKLDEQEEAEEQEEDENLSEEQPADQEISEDQDQDKDNKQADKVVKAPKVKEQKTSKKAKTTKNEKKEKSPKNNKNAKNGKEQKSKKEKKPIHVRTSFSENYSKLQASMPALIITCISSFIIMGFVAVAIFFANVRGPEKVLVPDVVGKSLEDALLELQVKELYPKINLRYSDNPGERGTIIEQNPGAGAITKGYSRVSLVVSRGVLVDSVGNYVGQALEDVIQRLDTIFAGEINPIITLAPPEYKPDTAPAGTILDQNPPEGTSIYEPVQIQLVVSRGPNYENTKAPNVVGQSVNDLAQTITRSKIIFDITYHEAGEDEKPGTVVSQQTFEEEEIPTYSRVAVEMAMPKDPIDENYYGVFTRELVDYPYPVPMSLTAIPEEGKAYTLLEFNHVGGNVTIPYAVPAGTTLVLSVANKIQAKEKIN